MIGFAQQSTGARLAGKQEWISCHTLAVHAEYQDTSTLTLNVDTAPCCQIMSEYTDSILFLQECKNKPC